jgi:putative membrane protein
MRLVASIFLNGLLFYLASILLEGVNVDGLLTAILCGFVLGFINITIKPIITLLTLPFTVLTFGLFLLVINAAMILVVDSLIPGFEVNGWWSALFFSIVLSLLNGIIGELRKKEGVE